MVRLRFLPAMAKGLFAIIGMCIAQAEALVPVVEIEEPVYQYTPADNGAGPMWCHGSTSIARVASRIFVTGLETVGDAKPLNNCRWFLMERTDSGWETIYTDRKRTREPSPIAGFNDERLFISANPTLAAAPNQYAGPSSPEVLQFSFSGQETSSTRHLPIWDGEPRFSEHSYRSFAADAESNELILIQNIGYTHAEWSFLDHTGEWSAQGKLKWPNGSDYSEPQPIRVCYPNVAIKERAVYFCGVSDILEPNPEWREFKYGLTGQKWDYDFRRLFFTWTPDITTGEFKEWVEVSSREKTAGRITPGDLWVAPDGDVHVIWTERALDERLREKFFPDAKQSHGLYHAVVRDGKVVFRRALVLTTEGRTSNIPGRGRFQVTSNGDLFVVCVVNRETPTGRIWENWLIPIKPDLSHGERRVIPLKRAFTDFFTATLRAGSPPGPVIDLLGTQTGLANTMSYARIRLE